MDLLSFLSIWLSIETAIPPHPTDEIKKMIANLDHDEWTVREKAVDDLKKEGYKALRACMDAQKNHKSLEVQRRAEIIVTIYFGVHSDDDKCPVPNIWMLDNDDRFPEGFSYTPDTDPANPADGDYVGGKGWCKELKTSFDVSVFYYNKAKENYNNWIKDSRLEVGNDDWLHEQIGREAMVMYVKDQLYYGRNREEIKKMLNKAVKMMKTHSHLHRHYPDANGSFRKKREVPPGPLIRSEEVPPESENRYPIYWHGCGGCAWRFGLVDRRRQASFPTRPKHL